MSSSPPSRPPACRAPFAAPASIALTLLVALVAAACRETPGDGPDAGDAAQGDAGVDAATDAADASGCAAGQVANDAGCLGALGAPCGVDAECAQGGCRDGVCCDGPCDGPCEACGPDGACGPAPDGPDDHCPTHCVSGACQPCPPDMAAVEAVCVDRFEAPNRPGALPLVMYTFLEAEAWCGARGRRLCFDDEWTRACGGPALQAYPYGPTHQPGVCNDEEVWRTYDQPLLSAWPSSASTPDATSLETLLEAARAVSAGAAASADHVAWLYQGEPAAANAGCTYGAEGVYDLTGNVEEWTRRRDGGTTDFHGNLKGRYWAETRTCLSNITVHGDGFRFYEIGFRCCAEPLFP